MRQPEDTVHPARRLWELYETVHDVVYFADECRDAAADLGLRGFWMGYFAFRAAPLGAVGPAPVTALFAGFHPDMVARALPDAWSHTTPADALRARRDASAAALRRVGVTDDHATAEAADLLWQAADAAATAGRPLAAANAALLRPDRPVEALWQACTVLREHRGDGHLAALLTHRIDPVEAHLVKVAAAESDEDMLQNARRWPPGAWQSARDRLHHRGWLTPDATLTPAGQAAHTAVENDTDRLAAAPLAALTPTRLRDLTGLLEHLADAVTRSGVIPRGNPTGLTRTPSA